LQTYISNYEKYNQIVNEHKEDMDPIMVDKIQNIAIYKQSLDLKIQFEVLGQSLNKLEVDNITVADVFDKCNDLRTNPNLQQYNKKIKEKSEKAIKSFHALCFITDPKYRKQQKNYHRCGGLVERTRIRFVANIIGLPNKRRRCVSKEHVWRHGNGKMTGVLMHYDDQNNK
jgi:hypothetical protein